MIIITTQIETENVTGGLSVCTALEKRGATKMEEHVYAVFEAAMKAAAHYLMESKGGNMISGEENITELVKARIEAGGLTFEGSAIDKVLKAKREREGL